MPDWLPKFTARFPEGTADTAALLVSGVQPACAISPSTEADVAAAIRFAAAHRIPVVPEGGGTAQGTIAPPPAEFLLLSTRRLNKLIHHEPGDMVATAQAGMSVAEFQSALCQRGQWLPIDAPPAATLGGIVSANTHGPRALGYGTLRDMLLGMTVVNGDGVIRKCGGKVVKNVTGYALDKLYIGSQGTLGVVTEVTFKLRPLPVDGRQWHAEFDSLQSALAALRAVSEKNLPLEMLRVVNSKWKQKPEPELAACATGTEAELLRIDSELRAAVSGREITAVAYDPDKPDDASLPRNIWALRQSQFWGDFESGILNRARAQRTASGATMRFGCVASKLDDALRILERHQNGAWSLGINGAAFELGPLDETEVARITVEFETLGVNFAFENVSGLTITNRWGTPRPERALMKQLKAALDPQGIMNPGRFVV